MIEQVEKIPEQCHPDPLEDLVSLDGDYLVLVGRRDFGEDIPKQRNHIVTEIKQKYGIKDDTCTAAILDYLKDSIVFQPGTNPKLYPFIYNAAKKWSKSTVRKSLRRLEDFGVLKRMYFTDAVDVKDFIWLREMTKKTLGSDPFRQKATVMQAHLSEKGFRPPKLGDLLMDFDVKTIREGEEVKLDEEEGVLDKICIRGMSDSEKAKAASELLHKPYRSLDLNKYNIRPRPTYNQQQRIQALQHSVNEGRNLPNILRLYSGGSLAAGNYQRDSDVDVLIVRKFCPGYEKCGARLSKPGMVDLFCFTQEELQQAHYKKLAILIDAKEIYRSKNS